jgi:uncharacterized protein (DUF1697 family)
MQRYIALLRGINVGGHRVRMSDLGAIFEELGLQAVETFIASGNVVFHAEMAEREGLQVLIEQRLRERLGYEVATFLRSPAELAAIASYEPFPSPPAGTYTLSVMFLDAVPPPETQERLSAFRTSTDEFRLRDREIFWLCHGRTSDSQVDWKGFGKIPGISRMTVRNVTTIRKLAARYGVSNAG